MSLSVSSTEPALRDSSSTFSDLLKTAVEVCVRVSVEVTSHLNKFFGASFREI
jgi:hypothetical protein